MCILAPLSLAKGANIAESICIQGFSKGDSMQYICSTFAYICLVLMYICHSLMFKSYKHCPARAKFST